MRIGIIFGGQSREREISFAGGRTVYDNLNKSMFTPIPIFVDSFGNFILLDWKYIYKGTIRDFYPPLTHIPKSEHGYQIYIESLADLSKTKQEELIAEVGEKISPENLKDYIDFAFLTLHGPYGEDGNIQSILEWYQIPYSGSGILPSAIGIDKVVQKDVLTKSGFEVPQEYVVKYDFWTKNGTETTFIHTKSTVGLPMVVKSPHQGSSIGVTVLKEDDFESFEKAVNKSFFIEKIDLTAWKNQDLESKRNQIIRLTDIRQGVGLPLIIEEKIINHPDELHAYLDTLSINKDLVLAKALDTEDQVLIESFIKGTEFSCIVIQNDNGIPIALPPTQIIKYDTLFDYRAKYLPGMSRKVTPMHASDDALIKIRALCSQLFEALHAQVYARIDGFLTKDEQVFLNDPNTTSGMLPSSFFFHQAAEIGLNPSQFLSYIIRTSLVERLKHGKHTYKTRALIEEFDKKLNTLLRAKDEKIKVAVIMGGFSSERHISVESGRNIYEKLASSEKYAPVPVFLSGNEQQHILHLLPINIMLKDNADDIKEKINNYEATQHPLLMLVKEETKEISKKFVDTPNLLLKQITYDELAELVDRVFIALHGRPGEDGAVQQELEARKIPYNGSDRDSSSITINKFETNKLLKANGILVAEHRLVYEQDRQKGDALYQEIEAQFQYPFIAKPADDGCSSAVKKIKNRNELIAFCDMMFRTTEHFVPEAATILKLKPNEEFPQKAYFLIEDLISKKEAAHFLEITGGLLTHFSEQGEISYEVFEPSETLSAGEVLSLEEKFLAGEGQNITPARFDQDLLRNKDISKQVRADLEKTARILNVQGYARIDAFVRIYESGKVETIIIEVNSLPGMTPATCIFHQTALNNYKPYDFIDAILDFGAKRNKRLAHTT